AGHVPPPGNGAVALVVTADDRVPAGVAGVEVAGVAFGSESADPTARRLTPEDAVAAVAGRAAEEAGLTLEAVMLDPGVVLETTDRTPFRLAMTLRGLGHGGGAAVNPSGGLWASNPIFAAGLERVAHAALAVRAGAPLAVAHSSYGYAGQGQFVAVLRRPGGGA
ncbi:MAG TPA: hypothetical protein VI854_04700, partial [Acidimicrobiia bacterium]|nr:hypothetical protein [Acidimicrobiia bacterium]